MFKILYTVYKSTYDIYTYFACYVLPLCGEYICIKTLDNQKIKLFTRLVTFVGHVIIFMFTFPVDTLSVHTFKAAFFTICPSGLGGRLWRCLWAHPGGRPLSRPSAGQLSQNGRRGLRAADPAGPAGCCSRAGSPADDRITTAAAVPALAPAAGPAVRPL
jgi:hypothetical protein